MLYIKLNYYFNELTSYFIIIHNEYWYTVLKSKDFTVRKFYFSPISIQNKTTLRFQIVSFLEDWK